VDIFLPIIFFKGCQLQSSLGKGGTFVGARVGLRQPISGIGVSNRTSREYRLYLAERTWQTADEAGI